MNTYKVKFGYFTYTARKKNLNILNSMSKIRKNTQESFVYVAPLYQRCGAPQARPCTNVQGIP